ncbi:MAG: acyltransferase [Clostridia bacterium]|nr:acyltransferase [Clostridia bacterium]
MDRKRLWRTIRLNLARNRNQYVRDHHIFAAFGRGSKISMRVIPLYPELISIGNNVIIAAKVTFVPHDIIHDMLNHLPASPDAADQPKYREHIGCIRIDDNVFIGANTTILADVRIGSRVVVGAGSLVNKDLEGGYVYAGVPAKKICTFDAFLQKRRKTAQYPAQFHRHGDSVDPAFAKWLWEDFQARHQET